VDAEGNSRGDGQVTAGSVIGESVSALPVSSMSLGQLPLYAAVGAAGVGIGSAAKKAKEQSDSSDMKQSLSRIS